MLHVLVERNDHKYTKNVAAKTYICIVIIMHVHVCELLHVHSTANLFLSVVSHIAALSPS